MTPVAECKMCHSTNVQITRNGDGLFVATCYDCGNVTPPERDASAVDGHLVWVQPKLEQPA